MNDSGSIKKGAINDDTHASSSFSAVKELPQWFCMDPHVDSIGRGLCRIITRRDNERRSTSGSGSSGQQRAINLHDHQQ
jgi:hypothetical protein